MKKSSAPNNDSPTLPPVPTREGFFGRVWAWLIETFPERQIYIRRDGSVLFFTYGSVLQATLALLTFLFLGWVAFATVNVLFTDRIVSAKTHRYADVQSAYENRVAMLQDTFDKHQRLLAESFANQREAIACMSGRCDPSTQAKIKKVLMTELTKLNSLGYGPVAPTEPSPVRPETSPISNSNDSRVSLFSTLFDGTRRAYLAGKQQLDAVFGSITGKKNARLDDSATFFWTGTAVWALLVVTKRFFGRLIRRLLRRESSVGASVS